MINYGFQGTYPPYFTQIGLGNKTDALQFNKFANRTILNTVDGLALISGSNTINTYTILDSPTTLTLTYNNTTDGAGTNGAQILFFDYIDENFLRATAVHVLGSTGSDTTSFTTYGVNDVAVVLSGSSRQNVNNISITATTGGSAQAFIKAGEGLNNFSVIHTPTDEKLHQQFLLYGGFRASGGQNAIIKFSATIFNRNTNTYYTPGATSIDTNHTSTYSQADPSGFILSGNTVVIFRSQTDQNNVNVNMGISHVFYKIP